MQSTIYLYIATVELSRQHYSNALRFLVSAHVRQNALATAVLGFCFEFGLGVEKDMENAERLYITASTRGALLADTRLAFLKTYGRPGIFIDLQIAAKHQLNFEGKVEESVAWFRIASEMGLAEAQFCLAIELNKSPSTKDHAFYWCKQAADAGVSQAQNFCGNFYCEGIVVDRDYDLGMMWYIKAAEARDPSAIYNIGSLFECGHGVPQSLVEAMNWYLRAAKHHSLNAHNVLGIFYEQGVLGNTVDPIKSVMHYKESALHGHPHGMYNLARCYHDGFGVQSNQTFAFLFYKRAALQNHILAQLSTAICLEYGIGTTVQMKRAVEYYEMASKSGSKAATVRLVLIVTTNYVNATKAILKEAPKRTGIASLPIELRMTILNYLNTLNVLSRDNINQIYKSVMDPLATCPSEELKNELCYSLTRSCNCVSEDCCRIPHIINGLQNLEKS